VNTHQQQSNPAAGGTRKLPLPTQIIMPKFIALHQTAMLHMSGGLEVYKIYPICPKAICYRLTRFCQNPSTQLFELSYVHHIISNSSTAAGL